MTYSSLLIHDILVINPEGEGSGEEEIDRYGNPIVVDDEGTAERARIQQIDQSELLDQRDTRVTMYKGFFTAATVLTAISKVVWAGDEYTVVGDPLRIDGRWGLHHVEAELQRVEEG